MSIYDIDVNTITGEKCSLSNYQGKVLLVVNVASKCGLTAQYEELEALYKAKAADGLEILGFPCNQFLGQEPGNEAEIQQFCTLNYGVTFPMFAKIEVNGANRHPLYQALITAKPSAIKNPAGGLAAKLGEMKLLPSDDSDIMWNFEKFLISSEGEVLARFAPDVTVTSVEFKAELDKVLA